MRYRIFFIRAIKMTFWRPHKCVLNTDPPSILSTRKKKWKKESWKILRLWARWRQTVGCTPAFWLGCLSGYNIPAHGRADIGKNKKTKKFSEKKKKKREINLAPHCLRMFMYTQTPWRVLMCYLRLLLQWEMGLSIYLCGWWWWRPIYLRDWWKKGSFLSLCVWKMWHLFGNKAPVVWEFRPAYSLKKVLK